MIRFMIVALAALLVFVLPVSAQNREMLGHGRLVNNDLLGDFKDRWQSGSVASSRVIGFGWNGNLPSRPFDLLEFRLGGQVVTPEDFRNPSDGDRPFVGALSLGLHTHFERGGTEISMGGDLVVTGPQTGLGDLHTAIHDVLRQKPARPSVLDDQIEDGFHPTFVGEAGRQFTLGRGVLRPFSELRWGAETLGRVGADFTIGQVGQGELLIRDPVTGQRYRTIYEFQSGLSYVVGGDFAWVENSVFLPEDRGYEVEKTRTRLRAGMHWQGERNATFFGVTYLSEEFDDQDEGQLVGSVRLKLKF
ncbi:MAG: lipid A-modifier LpxR family protein [Pelagimonas sp.]|uniref:lipid A-modifier LpxR family protein n=1 Tax=Pelagimonas sp. TaxID=2073170 RepID=UPI003D6ABFF1